jgi:hypothetical protein
VPEPGSPAGVLVVRVWSEPGDGDELRSRLRATLDVTTDGAEEWAVAGRDDLLDTIERWLDRFVAAPETRETPETTG